MKEISDHILDILQNSYDAGATSVTVLVSEQWADDRLVIHIKDNGRGMDLETTKRTADPFFTSRKTRKVGMGIPLLRQHSEMTGGKTDVSSAVGSGTAVESTFRISHPDRQPMGDLAGIIVMMMEARQEVELALKVETPLGQFEISSSEIKRSLDIERIAGNELREQLTNLILNNMASLGFRA